MQAHHKSEIAAKDATIADLEKSVAYYKNLQESFGSRWQQLTERERSVKEKERALERRERDIEEIIARRVAEDIKGKEKGLTDDWRNLFRKSRKLAAVEEKYNQKSALLDAREREMLKRAKLISEHLGVPLEHILTPREKKLVKELSKELTEEHYTLIELVMSCPERQAKDLLATVRLFLQNKHTL